MSARARATLFESRPWMSIERGTAIGGRTPDLDNHPGTYDFCSSDDLLFFDNDGAPI